jgi:hypothetical protein
MKSCSDAKLNRQDAKNAKNTMRVVLDDFRFFRVACPRSEALMGKLTLRESMPPLNSIVIDQQARFSNLLFRSQWESAGPCLYLAFVASLAVRFSR